MIFPKGIFKNKKYSNEYASDGLEPSDAYHAIYSSESMVFLKGCLWHKIVSQCSIFKKQKMLKNPHEGKPKPLD